MQAGEKKKLMVLAALVGILAAIWGYRLLAGGGREAEVGNGRAERRAWAVPPARPVEVHLGLLDRKKPRYRVGRNIFNPTYVEPVIKPPAPASEASSVVKVAPPPPPPPPPPKPREQLLKEKAEAEMKNFKFIGFIKRSDRTDIFLTLNDKYYMASKGEDITNGYYLKDIGPDFLLFADRESEATFRLAVNFAEAEKDASTLPSPGKGGAPYVPRPGASPTQGAPRRPSAGARAFDRGMPGGAAGVARAGEGDKWDNGGEQDGWGKDKGWDNDNNTAPSQGAASVPGQGAVPAPDTLKNHSTR